MKCLYPSCTASESSGATFQKVTDGTGGEGKPVYICSVHFEKLKSSKLQSNLPKCRAVLKSSTKGAARNDKIKTIDLGVGKSGPAGVKSGSCLAIITDSIVLPPRATTKHVKKKNFLEDPSTSSKKKVVWIADPSTSVTTGNATCLEKIGEEQKIIRVEVAGNQPLILKKVDGPPQHVKIVKKSLEVLERDAIGSHPVILVKDDDIPGQLRRNKETFDEKGNRNVVGDPLLRVPSTITEMKEDDTVSLESKGNSSSVILGVQKNLKTIFKKTASIKKVEISVSGTNQEQVVEARKTQESENQRVEKDCDSENSADSRQNQVITEVDVNWTTKTFSVPNSNLEEFAVLKQTNVKQYEKKLFPMPSKVQKCESNAKTTSDQEKTAVSSDSVQNDSKALLSSDKPEEIVIGSQNSVKIPRLFPEANEDRACSALNCPSRYPSRLFESPEDPARNKRWCQIALGYDTEVENKRIRLCSKHFRVSDFCQANRRELKNDAIPSYPTRRLNPFTLDYCPSWDLEVLKGLTVVCSAVNCGVRQWTHPEEGFFDFPSKTQSDVYRKWMNVAGAVREPKYLCSRHFDSSQFRDGDKKVGKECMIPSYKSGPLNPITRDYAPLPDNSADELTTDVDSPNKLNETPFRIVETSTVHLAEEMHNYQRCDAVECPSTYKNDPRIKYFSFPAKVTTASEIEKKRRRLWIDIVGGVKEGRAKLLCQYHFPTDAFIDRWRTILARKANPLFPFGPLNPNTRDYCPIGQEHWSLNSREFLKIRCCVDNCQSYCLNLDGFFGFPLHDREAYREWTIRIGIHKYYTEQEIRKKLRICPKHFSHHCITIDGNDATLKFGALPTIKVPCFTDPPNEFNSFVQNRQPRSKEAMDEDVDKQFRMKIHQSIQPPPSGAFFFSDRELKFTKFCILATFQL